MRYRIGIFVLVMMVSSVSGLFAQEAGQDTNFSEPWVFSFDSRKWVVGHKQEVRGQRIIEYVLEGETVDNWSEMITSYWFMANEYITVGAMEQNFFDILKAECPTVETTSIKKEDDNSIFEWKTNGCPNIPVQDEIRRIAKFGKVVFNLSYVKKTADLSDEERTKWTSVIDGAYLGNLEE